MTGVLQAIEDHERYRVTPRIAPIDRVGALLEATRSVQPVQSGEHQDPWGISRRSDLSGLSRIIIGQAGIPFLKERPERAVECARPGLQ